MLNRFSCVHVFATLWTVTRQALLSMGFSRQEYWSVLLCPPSGDLPYPGIKLASLMSPALTGGFFTTSATWELTNAERWIFIRGETPGDRDEQDWRCFPPRYKDYTNTQGWWLHTVH